LGVILPGARSAAQQGERIGVIATPATAASNAYHQAIVEANPTAQVWEVGCPEFVPLIEQNQIHHPATKTIVQRYLDPLIEQQIDTLIYGCTHYPHLAPVIRDILPSGVNLVDPAVAVVKAAAQELELLQLRHAQPAMPSQFYVSGDPAPFVQLAQQWLGYTPVVQHCDLAAYAPPALADCLSAAAVSETVESV
jgi:glutamate racemase